jgi:osomolarity two-component system response regulator SKN7
LKVSNQVSNELLNHLSNLDERRRNSRHSTHSNHSGQSSANFHNGTLGVLPDGNDEPSAELRRARELLSGLEPDGAADRAFHRLSVAWQHQTSPPDSNSSHAVFSQPNSAALAPAVMHNPFLEDPRHLVYPVGQTVGIDPFHPDHIQHLPFALSQGGPQDASAQITPPPGKDVDVSLWGRKKPRIFLVEDDKVCSRIGAKFLSQIECSVDLAVRTPPPSVRAEDGADSPRRKTVRRRRTESTRTRSVTISSSWTSSCPWLTEFRRQCILGL